VASNYQNDDFEQYLNPVSDAGGDDFEQYLNPVSGGNASPAPKRADSILARLSKPEKALAESAPKAFRVYTGLRGTVDAGTQMLERALPQSVNSALDAADRYAYEKTGGIIGQPAPSAEMRTSRREAASALDTDGGMDWYQLGGAVADPAAWATGSAVFKRAGQLVKNAPAIVKAVAPSMAAGGVVAPLATTTAEDTDSFIADLTKNGFSPADVADLVQQYGYTGNNAVYQAIAENSGVVNPVEDLSTLTAPGVVPSTAYNPSQVYQNMLDNLLANNPAINPALNPAVKPGAVSTPSIKTGTKSV